jgi:hypothetical protein
MSRKAILAGAGGGEPAAMVPLTPSEMEVSHD